MEKSIKRLIGYYLILLLLIISCRKGSAELEVGENLTELPDTLYLGNEAHFEFAYDNKDSDKFGVEFFSHGLPLGQPALVLNNQDIFIADAFHNNVKRISMSGDSVRSSDPLSFHRASLNDITLFNGKIYVSSELDTTYVLSRDLVLLNRFFVSNGRSQFVRGYGDDSLVLYFPDSHEYLTVNHRDQVVGKRSIAYADRHKEVYFRNKRLKRINKDLISTRYGVVVSKMNLFSNTIDFDSLSLVAIEQDSSSLDLSVFKFLNKRD